MPTLNEQTCPVCLSSADFNQSGLGRDSKTIVCMRCGPFEISGTALAMLDGRLIEDPFARPRLSHAIRTRTSEDNPIFVSSTNLDDFVHQSLPGVEQQLNNLVHWLAAQLSDDPPGRIPNLWPEMLAGIIGAVDGDRVNRLLRYGIEQGILEFDENRDLLGLSPQGWNMIAGEKKPSNAAHHVRTNNEEHEIIVAHCNICGGSRDAYNRASHSTSRSEREVSWSNTYIILECCGCHNVSILHTHWFSEWDQLETDPLTGEPKVTRGEKVTMWPSPSRRPKPPWLERLDDEILRDLLEEIYQALNSGMTILATIGTRTLLDRAMTLCVGDKQLGFKARIDLLEDEGFIGVTEKDILSIIVDAGSASAHRAFTPGSEILETIIATVENFLERQFILRSDVKNVEVATPKRNAIKR